MGDAETRGKGGLCTQSLLLVLRDTSHVRGGMAARTPIGFTEMLLAMYRIVAGAGFPSATFTLRSSLDLSHAHISCPASRALPSALESGGRPLRALLVGICYLTAPSWRLYGSWNDVMDMHAWLTSELGWPDSCVRVLTDEDGSGADMWPTRANILNHLQWLLHGVHRPDGSGGGCHLLHFCGHGDHDEIYPVDWESHGSIDGGMLS